MKQVIYADILIIVNTYINYFLLRVTALIARKKTSPLRLVIAGLVGSFYSFVIFIDNFPNLLLALSRIVFALIIVFLAFEIKNRKTFLRLVFSFFSVSFVFAGIMYAVWFFLSPKAMYYGNGVVYFNISTFMLAVLTVLAYAIIRIAAKIIEFKTPKSIFYQVEFSVSNCVFKESAFLDTGNSLKEPFSNFPVIIVFCEIVSVETKQMISKLFDECQEQIRYVPCSNIGGKTVLKAIKPDYLKVKGLETVFETKEVFIALTERKIHGGDHNVILNPAVFFNNTNETEKDYV